MFIMITLKYYRELQKFENINPKLGYSKYIQKFQKSVFE